MNINNRFRSVRTRLDLRCLHVAKKCEKRVVVKKLHNSLQKKLHNFLHICLQLYFVTFSEESANLAIFGTKLAGMNLALIVFFSQKCVNKCAIIFEKEK